MRSSLLPCACLSPEYWIRLRWWRHFPGDLLVCRVVTTLAQNERVLAPIVEDHELVGEAAAHHPDVCADRDRIETQPLEDALIGLVVQLVAAVEPSRVDVTAIAVLHDELANPDQAASASRLVAKLGLDVIDEQWQLSVAAHQVAEQSRHHLFVGHGQHHVAPGSVLESDQLRTDLLVAPALPPQVRGLDDRHLHLLAADAVHLLANDLLHAAIHAPAEWQK